MAWELPIFRREAPCVTTYPDWPRKGGSLLTRPISWVKGGNPKAHEVSGCCLGDAPVATEFRAQRHGELALRLSSQENDAYPSKSLNKTIWSGPWTKGSDPRLFPVHDNRAEIGIGPVAPRSAQVIFPR